ncbi:FIST signal transduction protein [Pleionea sp. CnH1-48]|uniref:FIST signal transduction protein n=1 Tax=Pleionea sp. CnH1-48 TaxID=2954494 RepID=UPI002097A240|nr:FIST N-terminal domain-containing protein [Pleionea sp. CnH1-48]MCO7223872.1 FIST C-terminal domain-containing protein [Pleionea sp. CnH1-48]
MNVSHFHFVNGQWTPSLPDKSNANWLLAFGHKSLMQEEGFIQSVRASFPNAEIMGCTTSGEIINTEVYDDSMVLTAIEFANTQVKTSHVNIKDFNDSFAAGEHLSATIAKDNLKHIFVLSDGQQVNGSSLVRGLEKNLPPGVLITGGLAGDGDRFESTYIWHNELAQEGLITIGGLYGDSIKIGHGSLGGWDTFGPDRLVTQSDENVLYELDDTNALKLYKEYLGEYVHDLPASALLFPLYVTPPGGSPGVVRTILSIDEDKQSMTFAGNVTQGSYAKMMRANFDRLIDGAGEAAENALSLSSTESVGLAILISCVGRRLILKQRTEDELESVSEVIPDTPLCGFYSYGEISPLLDTGSCKLHNQTMTITMLTEDINA